MCAFLKGSEVRELLQISGGTLAKMIKAGIIAARRVGEFLYIAFSEIERITRLKLITENGQYKLVFP